MSKRREQVVFDESEIAGPLEGDLSPYVIFTQLTANGPFIYAGWLDAADDSMAIAFAREHYGQDQECVSLWAAPRAYVAGMRMNIEAAAEEVPERDYRIFVQKAAGDQHRSTGTVSATCAKNALDAAWAEQTDDPHNLWAIPCDEIIGLGPDEVIWRLTDQTYRLARGYSKDVREKWERIREEIAIKEYEKEDLEESF